MRRISDHRCVHEEMRKGFRIAGLRERRSVDERGVLALVGSVLD
jgi:hypothetical protein